MIRVEHLRKHFGDVVAVDDEHRRVLALPHDRRGGHEDDVLVFLGIDGELHWRADGKQRRARRKRDADGDSGRAFFDRRGP